MRHSLRARLAIAALLSITLALLVAAFSLIVLFERHVERRIGAELEDRLNQLAAAVVISAPRPADGDATRALTVAPRGPAGGQAAADGELQPERVSTSGLDLDPPPADPRFQVPLSGLYWQIDDLDAGAAGIGVMRSRSLWDAVLQLPRDRLPAGAVHAHLVNGPGGQRLLVRERSVRLGQAKQVVGGEYRLRLAVAQDRAEIVAARNAFARDMLPYLGVIALVLGIATWFQIRTGLAPLETVRKAVNAVRAGRLDRLPTQYPEEVKPLALEVNALLEAREDAVARARGWTADLAHGLKTPLSALAADAQRLRQQGHPELAEDLEALADLMRRRVDRELIRARVRTQAHPHQARADVGHALRRLIATLQRTPGGERLRWELRWESEMPGTGTPDRESSTGPWAALVEEDLLELLGNLLENAAKWARSRVRLSIGADRMIQLTIGDDGPGVPEAQRNRLGERGLRLDQRKAGSGLGLAIARDVVEAYGGSLDFGRSELGGLEVRVRMPAVERD